jgi:hypothetical protein
MKHVWIDVYLDVNAYNGVVSHVHKESFFVLLANLGVTEEAAECRLDDSLCYVLVVRFCRTNG